MTLRHWLLAGVLVLSLAAGCKKSGDAVSATSTCSQYGAEPITTVPPVTRKPLHEDAELLTWEQDSVTRYACLNYPSQADSADRRWPLLVYLHGSLTTPSSLYEEGRQLFELRDTFQLSLQDSVQGFIILSPEGRHAQPWDNGGIHTGLGFHWDEWYRNPDENLDALAIDHFLDVVMATGKVDPSQVYVMGWSNGAFMTVLYSTWRSTRIAAMAQYAGANPWRRWPCPIPMQYDRQVPLVLLRNLCDALVPCDTTNAWIDTLEARAWPFTYYSLDKFGTLASNDSPCETHCSEIKGKADHVHWPKQPALIQMLEFLKAHPLDSALAGQVAD